MINFRKFKKLHFIVCILIIGLSSNLTVSAREKMGGVNGGGGNEIESLFISKALEMSESLMNYDYESQKLLGFDPNELYVTLNDREGFYALCATGTELQKIQTENKMAMVFNEKPGTVYLNCTDFKLDQWKTILDLNNLAGSIFVLHESLRIMDLAGENNYGNSKNYIKAFKNKQKIYHEKILYFLLNTDRP
jgi:hypothetical protein